MSWIHNTRIHCTGLNSDIDKLTHTANRVIFQFNVMIAFV